MSEQWRTAQFRANIVRKINDHITTLNLTVKNDAAQMENNIFQKASTEHEYLSFIAKLIVYLREKSVSAERRPVVTSASPEDAKVSETKEKSVMLTTSTYKCGGVAMIKNERFEPSSAQKLDILKTAIATVLQNPNNWRTEQCDDHLKLFGDYVASQLSQITSEEQLISTQQKIMSILNKMV